MNKRQYIYIIIIVLVSGFLSCKKSFLDVNDNSALYRQNYVVDLKTTQEYLNGVYTMLGGEFYRGYNIIYADLAADNIKPVSTAFIFQYNWNQTSNDDIGTTPAAGNINMNSFWGAGYRIIAATNFVLEKANEYKNEDQIKANTILGQAYAIRALIHLMMVNIFAQPFNFTNGASHPGIPYVYSYDWTKPIEKRHTVAEVFANLIDDLSKSIQSLPTTSTTTLEINLATAKALLSRTYFLKGDYANAKNLATEVLDQHPLLSITQGYPDNLFKLLAPSETESLFQLAPAANFYVTIFAGSYFRSPRQFYATNDIAEILTESANDARNLWVSNVSGKWHILKFPSGVVSGISNTSRAYYQTVIRSSELSLIAAESYFEIGTEDSARYYLNQVRQRADESSAASTDSGPALKETIHKERRKELAFEGFRMFDLLRWKQDVNRVDAVSPDVQKLVYPSDKAISPLPGNDVRLTGISQNPGY